MTENELELQRLIIAFQGAHFKALDKLIHYMAIVSIALFVLGYFVGKYY